ncbi:MAG TPA: SDR family oxidoreductase, partial [Candidatus Fraserbacteria bacterium]|nr:SDR family oxidoreductase [Candidatus Fraserbacteria bacterium]
NAGISPVFKPMAEVTLAEWDQVLGVNLRGAFLLSQEIGRAMIRQGRGSIINIASIAGMRGVSHIGAYAVSKAGLIQLTRVLATEWAAQGIRVNAIAPGWVETAMTQPVMAQAELYQGLLATIPQKRFAAPEEIAGLAVYLASEAASFVTGQVYVADGGQTI